MAVKVNGKEVEAAVLDFDGTFYQLSPADQKRLWGNLHQQLAINALKNTGLDNPSQEKIDKTVSEYERNTDKLGYKGSFLALGGTEKDYKRLISMSVPITEFLTYDFELVKILSILMQHLGVYVFTGSPRERFFNALEELIGNLSDQFVYKRVLAMDDMRQGTKPDRKAYQEMVERFALNPETTIFVDDQQSEVKTAASLGMITFLIQQDSQGQPDFSPHIVIKSLHDLLEHLQIED
jgi:FMN phosphatase YigB (HAD superfamily)